MDKQGDQRLIFGIGNPGRWHYQKPTLSHSRVQTSRENKTENNLISVLKLKEDTLQRIERLTEERMKISELIDKLANPLERSVLRLFT